MDRCFGLAKSNSVLLSDIARLLEEPIDTIQTIKPFPIYSHLYSSIEDGFISSNEETIGD